MNSNAVLKQYKMAYGHGCNCKICLLQRYTKHKYGQEATNEFLEKGFLLEGNLYDAQKAFDEWHSIKGIDKNFGGVTDEAK